MREESWGDYVRAALGPELAYPEPGATGGVGWWFLTSGALLVVGISLMVAGLTRGGVP